MRCSAACVPRRAERAIRAPEIAGSWRRGGGRASVAASVDRPETTDEPTPAPAQAWEVDDDAVAAQADDSADADDAAEPDAPAVEAAPPRGGRLRRSVVRTLRWSKRNGYVVVLAGAILVVTRAIDFSPPPEVRVGKANVAQLVGDAPPQEFSHELANPQAVQVRATLRLYPDNQLLVGAPDPDTDAQGKVLSQPVVTTILGMNATMDQTVRLDGGELEVAIAIDATPRLSGTPKRGQPAPPLVLEHEITVRSRHDDWWRTRPVERVHVDQRGFLDKVDEHGYRTVFTVDDHLFSLDLELHRSAAPPPALARTKP